MGTTRRLVWFKRDLRLHDHAPLAEAAQGPAVALWIIEPEWLESPEFHPRHYAFARASVDELRQRLAPCGLPLIVRVGRALDVLAQLHAQHGYTELLSHEETGPGWTYDRDRAVADWCREQGVAWREWPQHGVIRRLRNRSGWSARWAVRMNAPQAPEPARFEPWPALQASDWGELPCLEELTPQAAPPELQTPGEAAALALLEDFVTGRGRGYRRALSSPVTAEDGCSRLSPHLAFGTLSLRRTHQRTEAAIAEARAAGDAALASGLRGFSGRLRWHCHFMQKLEDEPAIEFRNFARSCDGLRPGDDASPNSPPWGPEQDQRLKAWCEGRTGYPMVDACMRSLNATGWLNFRMRAMLVSFASYHLWLHWRPTGLHLARQYTDFEAGIHWSQMQMQSGTTGINTLRVYSPTKQALDQDPNGEFIRRWVPELRHVPLSRLHQPWLMDESEQQAARCVIGRDYPAPIVDEKQVAREAKDAMYSLRRLSDSRAEADQIQDRHGSRKSGLPSTAMKPKPKPNPKTKARRASQEASAQPDLFSQE